MGLKLSRPSSNRSSLGAIAASAALLVALGGCTAGCKVDDSASSTQHAPAVRTVSEEAALADFDRMWQLVNDTHFDTTFNGTDWEAVRDELRPQAAQAQNRREIRGVMSDALGRLGVSHFGIIPQAPADHTPATSTNDSDNAGDHDHDQDHETNALVPDDSATDGMGNADTGIEVRIIDMQVLVTKVRPDSPAANAGVKPGWILSKARTHDMGEVLAELAESIDENELEIHGVGYISGQLQGPDGSSIDLTFIDGTDQEVTLDIERAPMPGEFYKFGNLPPMSTHLDWHKKTFTNEQGHESDIGVITFNVWMMPIAGKFERAMYELRDSDGIIIDLRGNPGGIGQLAASVSRFFMSEKGSLGTMKMRGAELSFNIEPVIVTTWGERLKPFDGPIAVLTDSGSASTSEVFAGGLQSLNRIEVFGTRSAGMALPAMMDKLPSGDVLLHAIADFETSTGYQLEHGGVVPDHEVKLTRQDLLRGVDSPKAAAMEWIAESVNE